MTLKGLKRINNGLSFLVVYLRYLKIIYRKTQKGKNSRFSTKQRNYRIFGKCCTCFQPNVFILIISECPKDMPVVACYANPCATSTCPAFPKARCQANYCGGCNAEFFVDDKKVDCGMYKITPNYLQVFSCVFSSGQLSYRVIEPSALGRSHNKRTVGIKCGHFPKFNKLLVHLSLSFFLQ